MYDSVRSFASYCEHYLLGRDVSPTHAATVRRRCERLTEFAGGSLRVSDLDDELLNQFLASLQASKLQPPTVRGYRADLLAVWRAAASEGMASWPQQIRPCRRKSTRPVEAFTLDEVRSLLDAAATLTGNVYGLPISRATWWPAMIRVAYDSGLRRGDLLSLRRSQVATDGTLGVVMRKTGQPHRVRLRPSTRACVDAMGWDGSEYLPWRANDDSLTRWFGKIVRRAAVRRGTLKWLRRSAASYAERERPGAGSALLGHRSTAVFAAHYEDRSITQPDPVQPPELP